MKQGGAKPTPRSGMSIATASANKAYFFGGVIDDEDDDDELKSHCVSDFYLLETDKGVWKQLELRHDVSSPSSLSSSLVPPDRC